MILDVAISEVQQILGFRSDKVPEITRALAFAQEELEKPNRTYPWFLRNQNDSAIITVKNTVKYNIPTDYIEDTDELEGNLFIFTIAGQINSRTIFLKKQAFELAQVRYYGNWPYIYANPPGAIIDQSTGIGPGVPREYYLGDTFVILYPVPDNVYNISWRYWAKDTAQAIGVENKWLKNAPWVLIGMAALKLGMDLGNPQAVSTAQAVLAQAESNLFKAVINRNEAGKRRNMGSRL